VKEGRKDCEGRKDGRTANEGWTEGMKDEMKERRWVGMQEARKKEGE
jgi:hypothetical protein